MATFPDDMSIGWGFGLKPQEDEPHLTDPRLSVSELEERVRKSAEYAGKLNEVCIRHKLEIETLKVHKTDLEQRVCDLEERLRSLTIVVNSLVEAVQANEPAYVQGEKD